MWHCASLCLLVIVVVWMISYGLMKHDINENKIEVNIIRKDTYKANESGKNVGTNPKVKHHVPKYMLDLYERSKSVKKDTLSNSTPDVVRSVVPTHTGKCNDIFLILISFKNKYYNCQKMIIYKNNKMYTVCVSQTLIYRPVPNRKNFLPLHEKMFLTEIIK